MVGKLRIFTLVETIVIIASLTGKELPPCVVKAMDGTLADVCPEL